MPNYYNNFTESTIKTNERRCKCYLDGHTIIERGEGFGYFVPSRGMRYICDGCASNLRNADGYHTSAREGFDSVGTHKKGTLEATHIGVEFEAKNIRGINDLTLRGYLSKIGRIEHDGSVDYEVPSAIMEGLKTLSKALEYIERGGFICCFNNEQCGAHIHVECTKVDYLRRYYHSVFLPLAKYIDNMGSAKRIECFGSDFRYYARMIDEESRPLEHTNLFNMQHNRTIEFRLPRITSKDEYMRIAKFWREVGCTINNFDFHENSPLNKVRKAEAKKCGLVLVNIAKKYFEA